MSAVVEIESLEQIPQVYNAQLVTQVETTLPEMLPLTADRKAVLLNTLIATGGNLTKAARLLGMSRQNVFRWCQSDPVFAELYQEALEAGTENLEERAYLRAINDSDRMMELLLKARKPEKYREQTPAAAVQVNVNVNRTELSGLLTAVLDEPSD